MHHNRVAILTTMVQTFKSIIAWNSDRSVHLKRSLTMSKCNLSSPTQGFAMKTPISQLVVGEKWSNSYNLKRNVDPIIDSSREDYLNE